MAALAVAFPQGTPTPTRDTTSTIDTDSTASGSGAITNPIPPISISNNQRAICKGGLSFDTWAAFDRADDRQINDPEAIVRIEGGFWWSFSWQGVMWCMYNENHWAVDVRRWEQGRGIRAVLERCCPEPTCAGGYETIYSTGGDLVLLALRSASEGC
ncbi:hypothetical protein CC1G_05349 [Coprinopsis cinerea okayama7|uniref:Uncharacterized protein n=1 Tax=Coprinopsis cinerea (strain Okayama-7 / 130 / ATCC MYA-4618 / FGSC 9003) TaxID=240176 RepID=A8NPS0_COPC7|nr:hypothetical protein CC1G_05349 [Coprinopsis cinerea okayama7\|eukprot:XP_001835387.2 hypothetical protein CC1G_05349 [Coprinopsis cinerea okayama7\